MGGARGARLRAGRLSPSHNRHTDDTDTAHMGLQASTMAEDPFTDDTVEPEGDGPEPSAGLPHPDAPAPVGVPSWIALPVGRAETGPSIAELVDAVRAAGGMVGGDALFDPRYEAEMRRFLIRALEMEGVPIPRGGDTP